MHKQKPSWPPVPLPTNEQMKAILRANAALKARASPQPRGDSLVPRAALSVDEFCESMGICRSTFYQEVHAGHIKILKAGKRTLVPATELEAFLQRLEKQAS